MRGRVQEGEGGVQEQLRPQAKQGPRLSIYAPAPPPLGPRQTGAPPRVRASARSRATTPRSRARARYLYLTICLQACSAHAEPSPRVATAACRAARWPRAAGHAPRFEERRPALKSLGSSLWNP